MPADNRPCRRRRRRRPSSSSATPTVSSDGPNMPRLKDLPGAAGATPAIRGSDLPLRSAPEVVAPFPLPTPRQLRLHLVGKNWFRFAGWMSLNVTLIWHRPVSSSIFSIHPTSPSALTGPDRSGKQVEPEHHLRVSRSGSQSSRGIFPAISGTPAPISPAPCPRKPGPARRPGGSWRGT